jgi:Na+/H+ antiporter NhaC
MIIPSKKYAVILVSVTLVSLYFLNFGHLYAQNTTNSTAGAAKNVTNSAAAAVGGAAKNAPKPLTEVDKIDQLRQDVTRLAVAVAAAPKIDPVPLLAIIGLIMVIPMIIDMVMAYLKKPAQNGQAPAGLPLAWTVQNSYDVWHRTVSWYSYY